MNTVNGLLITLSISYVANHYNSAYCNNIYEGSSSFLTQLALKASTSSGCIGGMTPSGSAYTKRASSVRHSRGTAAMAKSFCSSCTLLLLHITFGTGWLAYNIWIMMSQLFSPGCVLTICRYGKATRMLVCDVSTLL